MLNTNLARSVWQTWEAPPRPCHSTWIPANIRMPSETETAGDPFDLDYFPHFRAVLAAADNPATTLILLPWCIRSGKTIGMLSLLVSLAAQAPRPMQIARETEDKTIDLVDNQLTPLIAACTAVKQQLPPPHRRNPKKGLKLAACRIRASWPLSPGTMRGYPSCYNFASEISAWSNRETGDGDPVAMMMKRALLFESEQLNVMESSPGTIGRCRMTALCEMEGVDVRRTEVPCPHCGTYQPLVFGTADPDSPGLKWHKSGPRSSPVEAEKTAWYRCRNGCRIDEQQRVPMMRRIVWASEGQHVTKAGQLAGTARVPDATKIAFGHPLPGDNPHRAPFSQLYALRVPWGAIAREWLEKKGSTAGRREFYNQTLGRTWDPAPVVIKSDELIDRLATATVPLEIIPDWTVFTIFSADVGRVADELIFHWALTAWGRHARGHLVDYGVAWSSAALREVIGRRYPIDCDPPRDLLYAQAGFDSGDGNVTGAIYDLCAELPNAWPIKGGSLRGSGDFTQLQFVGMYRGTFKSEGIHPSERAARRRLGAYDLLEVNTQQSQEWIEDRISGLIKPTAPNWFSIPREALATTPRPGIDLPSQLVGDAQDEKGRWVKRYDAQHLRSALRYGVVLAWHNTDNGRLWPALDVPAARRTPPKSASAAAVEDERRREDEPRRGLRKLRRRRR